MIFLYIIIIFLTFLLLFYKWLYTKTYSIFTYTKKGVSKTPEDYRVVYEPVYFNSSDGVELSGWFIPSKNDSDKTLIITCGEFLNKSDMLEETLFLYEKFNLFYFDFRASGESKGEITTFGILEYRDLEGALDFLNENRSEFVNEIYIYGSSFLSLILSKRFKYENIKKVVIKNPVMNYLDFLKKVAKKNRFYFLSVYFIRKVLGIKNIDFDLKSLNIDYPLVILSNDESFNPDMVNSTSKEFIMFKDLKDLKEKLQQILIK